MSKNRVLIVDDHQVVIDGIKSTLKYYSEFEIIGEARNGREAVKQVKMLEPDIVIMDISMPDLNGVDATMQIKRLNQPVRMIIFTMYSDEEYVNKLMESGISAYVLKDDPIADLIKALNNTSSNEIFLSRSLANLSKSLNNTIAIDCEINIGFNELTLREREVLQLLAEGNTIKDVAEKLELSKKTVESHKYNIMQKLDTTLLADLTKIAIKKKLIKP